MSRIRDHFYEIEELELRQMNKYIITALLILSLSATAAGCAQKQQSPSSIPAETPHSDVMIRPAATEGPSETSQISESMEDTLGHLKLSARLNLGSEELPLNSEMKVLTSCKAEIDRDIEEMIPAGGVVDKIAVHHRKGDFVVAAVNPYENPVALKYCLICAITLSGSNNGITQGNQRAVTCGTTTADELRFGAPYEAADDRRIYRGWVGTGNFTLGSFNIPDAGDRVLAPSNDIAYTYELKDGVVSSICMEDLGLRYGGMEGNASIEALHGMDADEFAAAEAKRNRILDALREAFQAADLPISLNVENGEAVMPEKILFASGSAELSEEGKLFVDRFMALYGSVVLSAEYQDQIQSICFDGHTDSQGNYEYNLALSQQRAEAVLNYCLQSTENALTAGQRDALRSLANAQGYAYSNPVLDENGQEDAAASRRVAIRFLVDPS